VEAVGQVGAVNVWGDVDDTQNPDWQNLNTAQTSGWNSVTDTQDPNWERIAA